ncbi:MAG: Ku protein, partial [Myxococcota bacterium]
KVPKVYYAKTYYLGPDKGGDKAYKLLSEAMRVTGRCGLATYAARGKMYLVLVSPMGDGIAMYQLHYADEVVGIDEVPLGDAEPKEAEVGLAVQLIDQIANDRFEPQKYRDEVKARVEAAIQRKIEGQSITESAPEPEKADIIDLMQALQASLGAESSSAAEEPAPEEKPKAQKKRAKQAK